MRLIRKAMTMVILCLCTTILLITSCAGATLDFPAQNTAPENQFVIMYDISKSMDDADYRLQGMIADFMLKVPSQQRPYKIAIIPFAGKCPETDALANGDLDWWDIETENGETRERIRDALSELNYTGSYTNIEEALRKCAQILNEGRSNGKLCNQIVLFITDGVIDLPGDAGNSVRSRIDNIISSAERIPSIASDFPDDCQFWAIVPDDLSKSAFVTYDDAGNILTYYRKSVDADQQEGIRAALTCLDDFCNQLNMLQAEKMSDRAGTIPMDWTSDTLQNFKSAYTQFFESIWGTTTITKEQVDIGTGFDFFVPDGTEEVNITVMPEIENANRCKAVAEQLFADGNISITMDGLPQEFESALSIYTVNIKLINPPTGKYHLQTTAEEQCRFTLDFLTYNSLKIVISRQNLTAALGSTIKLEGSVLDAKDAAITKQTARNLLLEVCADNGSAGNGTRSAVELEAGEFQYNYTASHVGVNQLTFFLNYDDTVDPQIFGNIAKFAHQETITLAVPEVLYKGGGTQSSFSNTRFVLQPYSLIDGAQINVAAEAAKGYLGDDWVLRLLDEQGAQVNTDTPLILSEDGGYFVVECKTDNASSAVMFNRTTSMSIEVEIPGPDGIKMLIIFSLALILLIVVIIVIAILLSLRKITVSLRWNGGSEVLYLSKNGHPETGELVGESVTAHYDKANRQVVAHMNGRTKRIDVVGHSCDVNF